MCFNPGYLRTPSGALKIVEIICVSITFGIFRGERYAHFGNEDTDFFACGVLVAAIIITPLLLFCYLMGRLEIQRTMLETFINFLFFVFLLAAGSVALHTWTPYSYKVKGGGSTLAMGIFTLFAAVAYLADSFFACMNQRGLNEPWRYPQDGTGGPSRKIWEPPFWDRCRRDSNRWGNNRGQSGSPEQWQPPTRYEMNKNSPPQPFEQPSRYDPSRSYEPNRFGSHSYDSRYDANRFGPSKFESKQFESPTKLEPNKNDPTKYEPKKYESSKNKPPYW